MRACWGNARRRHHRRTVPACLQYRYEARHRQYARLSDRRIGASGFILSGWHHSDLPPWSLGYVDLTVLFAVGAMSMLVAPLGVRLAHHLLVPKLKRIFGIMLLMVALKMLTGS